MAEKLFYIREHRERLKERFKRDSFAGFYENEIVELVLTYAAPRKDVREVAERLLTRFKGLRGIFEATREELCKVSGMGENAAVLIRLIKDVAGVYLKERMMGKDVIRDPGDVLDYLKMTLSGARVEKFLAVYLNSKNEILSLETLHEGTINQTVVYPRKVIEKAFEHNAHSVIFVHNHPSGDATPSNLDRQLTGMLARAAHAVGLVVHDHLIIGRCEHFSARENGWFLSGPSNLRWSVRP